MQLIVPAAYKQHNKEYPNTKGQFLKYRREVSFS